MPGIRTGRRTVEIVLVIVVAVVVFYGAWIGSAYYKNYELQDYLNSVAVQATVQSPPVTAREIRDEIIAKASALGLPVQANNVQVIFNRVVLINLHYRVGIDFKFYILNLHFTPSADNRDLI